MGATLMNINTLKYILFGKEKPFQMTRENITFNSEEYNTLNEISDVIGVNPEKAIHSINQASFLNVFVDYIKEFNDFGKGDLNDIYDKQTSPSFKSEIYQKLSLNVGIIADQFLYDALEDVCQLTYINESKCNEQFDLVIVASTWKGIDGYWDGVTNPHRKKFDELKHLISSFQARKIPVVFFNKEDPVNFDVFLPHAQLVDIVVTTELELISAYKKALGHSKVYHLQFPVHLGLHNPIHTKEIHEKKEVVFAGSWLDKYEERNNDAIKLFDGVVNSNFDLIIFDRNLWNKQTKYQFPASYIPYIAAPLTHENTMKMHREHPFAINLNTIKYSKTMCANRIFELQGMGAFLLSNYNTFVNASMPQVQMIFDSKDVGSTLDLDPAILQRARKIGTQQVLREYNHFEWMKQIAMWCGMCISKTQWPEVSVIIDKEDQRAKEMFLKQYYPYKVCVQKLNEVETLYYTYFDSKNDYQPEYLDDLMSALTYVNSAFITKVSDGNRYVNHYENRAHTLFKKGEDSYQSGYASDLTFLNMSPIQRQAMCPKLSIVIPIHNNGAHLEHKALRSIIRNRNFSQFEIILVNDGSSDNLTLQTIELYEKWFSNIKVIHLENASGSASTPRNVGIQYASAPYLTFLDPDNEWVGDGINQLLDTIQSDETVDVVVGNMIKVDNEKTRTHQYYRQFLDVMHSDETKQTKELLKQTKLKTASIQALIARTTFVKQHHIEMVPGALGQDSLFFLKLMHYARKVKVIDAVIHVYYAAIDQSMTNTISPSFFDKYLKLEKEKLSFLTEQGYLNTYMDYRFNFYMKHWYIARIKRTKSLNQEVIKAFLRIYHLYDKFKRPYDDELIKEIKKLQSEVK